LWLVAFQAFLRIDDIPGESTSEQHPEWIDIDSFSWGVSQTQIHDGGAGGRGAPGEPARRPLHQPAEHGVTVLGSVLRHKIKSAMLRDALGVS
jgi:type VI protein secretion system component Hcp